MTVADVRDFINNEMGMVTRVQLNREVDSTEDVGAEDLSVMAYTEEEKVFDYGIDGPDFTDDDRFIGDALTCLLLNKVMEQRGVNKSFCYHGPDCNGKQYIVEAVRYVSDYLSAPDGNGNIETGTPGKWFCPLVGGVCRHDCMFLLDEFTVGDIGTARAPRCTLKDIRQLLLSVNDTLYYTDKTVKVLEERTDEQMEILEEIQENTRF